MCHFSPCFFYVLLSLCRHLDNLKPRAKYFAGAKCRRFLVTKRAKPTLIVWIHWDFTINAVHAFPKYKKINYFGFTHASSKVHFRSTEGQAFYWSIMTADDSINCRCANSGMTDQVGGCQESRGLSASVSFLSFPPPPCSFTCAIFSAAVDSRSSFFAHRPHRNACYARYLFVFYPWQRLCMFGLF